MVHITYHSQQEQGWRTKSDVSFLGWKQYAYTLCNNCHFQLCTLNNHLIYWWFQLFSHILSKPCLLFVSVVMTSVLWKTLCQGSSCCWPELIMTVIKPRKAMFLDYSLMPTCRSQLQENKVHGFVYIFYVISLL